MSPGNRPPVLEATHIYTKDPNAVAKGSLIVCDQRGIRTADTAASTSSSISSANRVSP